MYGSALLDVYYIYTGGRIFRITPYLARQYIFRTSGSVQVTTPLRLTIESLRSLFRVPHIRLSVQELVSQNFGASNNLHHRNYQPTRDNRRIEQPKDSPLKPNNRHDTNIRRGRRHELTQPGFPSKSQLGCNCTGCTSFNVKYAFFTGSQCATWVRNPVSNAL